MLFVIKLTKVGYACRIVTFDGFTIDKLTQPFDTNSDR